MRNFMHFSAGLEEDFDGCAHAEWQHRAARGLSKDNVPACVVKDLIPASSRDETQRCLQR